MEGSLSVTLVIVGEACLEDVMVGDVIVDEIMVVEKLVFLSSMVGI